MSKKKSVFLVGDAGYEHNEIIPPIHTTEAGAEKAFEKLCARKILEEEQRLARLEEKGKGEHWSCVGLRKEIAALKSGDRERMHTEIADGWPYIKAYDLEE